MSVILAPIDQGTRNLDGRPGSARAPERLLEALQDRKALPASTRILSPELANTPERLEDDLELITAAVAGELGDQRFVLVLGGDHGTTYATVRGAARALGATGVTYLDVHLDMRPYAPDHTSGSSFRRLIDEGLVEAGHVHPLGIQIPEDEAQRQASRIEPLLAYAEDHAVPWEPLEAVREAGVAQRVEAALSLTPNACFSFDVDCLDERWAPGVSAPGPDRFTLEEAQAAARAASGRCRVLDVAEYAPPLDVDERTLESTLAVLEAFLAGPWAQALGPT